MEFAHQFVPLVVKESWKKQSYTPGQLIEIYTNTDFPAYLANMNEIKELILRKASELKEQFAEPAES